MSGLDDSSTEKTVLHPLVPTYPDDKPIQWDDNDASLGGIIAVTSAQWSPPINQVPWEAKARSRDAIMSERSQRQRQEGNERSRGRLR